MTNRAEATMLAGTEIAMLELAFFLCDSHDLDRQALATRLEQSADRLVTQGHGALIASPLRRMAFGLRNATMIDAQGNDT